MRNKSFIPVALLIACTGVGCGSKNELGESKNSVTGKTEPAAELTLLYVSYDPTREFYQADHFNDGAIFDQIYVPQK